MAMACSQHILLGYFSSLGSRQLKCLPKAMGMMLLTKHRPPISLGEAPLLHEFLDDIHKHNFPAARCKYGWSASCLCQIVASCWVDILKDPKEVAYVDSRPTSLSWMTAPRGL